MTAKAKPLLISLLGCVIQAFGLYNIHSVARVTEGGILGLGLLFKHWFGISPAISTAILTVLCYCIGWRTLGGRFLVMSAVSGLGFSLCYFICEQFPPLWPDIVNHPFAAAVLGAVFIGIGAGLCVRMGGAPGGDDALAMALSKKLRVKITWVYLASDLLVLALSLTYIPAKRIAWSLLTVVLSGQILGFVADHKK